MPRTVARHDAGTVATSPGTIQKRKRITPYQAKKIAAGQGWRCGCGCVDPKDPERRGFLLDSCYEIDHRVPLSAGGSNEDRNLQAVLRAHHQDKTSAEAADAASTRRRLPIKMFNGG